MISNNLYDANNDEEIVKKRNACHDLCHAYNQLLPSNIQERVEMLERIIGSAVTPPVIEQPFYCDYGSLIHIGTDVYMNINTIMLDEAEIHIGDHVFIGPNCAFYTSGHPFDANQRRDGLEYALPIHVGNDVWIGGNVVILPGVTIGEGCVIAAGSVVNRDIPAYSLAGGNPCRIIRSLKNGKHKDTY